MYERELSYIHVHNPSKRYVQSSIQNIWASEYIKERLSIALFSSLLSLPHFTQNVLGKQYADARVYPDSVRLPSVQLGGPRWRGDTPKFCGRVLSEAFPRRSPWGPLDGMYL
jgi:hypothetical protein